MRLVLLAVLSVVCLAGCKKRSIDQVIVFDGKELHYLTTAESYGHGKKSRGEVWLGANGEHFGDLMGCSPYALQVDGSSYVVLSREKEPAVHELLIIDINTNEKFSVKFPAYLIGCGGISGTFKEGRIFLTDSDTDATVTIIIDPQMKRVESQKTEKHTTNPPEPNGAHSVWPTDTK